MKKKKTAPKPSIFINDKAFAVQNKDTGKCIASITMSLREFSWTWTDDLRAALHSDVRTAEFMSAALNTQDQLAMHVHVVNHGYQLLSDEEKKARAAKAGK